MTNEEFIKNISFEGEEWRDVVGFEGLYMVSSFGRVISLKREVRNTHCSYRVVGQHILTPNKNTSRPKYIRHSYHLYKNNCSEEHWFALTSAIDCQNPAALSYFE